MFYLLMSDNKTDEYIIVIGEIFDNLRSKDCQIKKTISSWAKLLITWDQKIAKERNIPLSLSEYILITWIFGNCCNWFWVESLIGGQNIYIFG